jgi:4-aminobutyrate aminotransferase-like enzyme
MQVTTLKSDLKYCGRDKPAFPLEIVKSKDGYLYNRDRKKYVDFLSGWCVGNIGWGNREIKNAIRNYKGPDYIYPNFLYRPWTELAEVLAEITPGKLKKSYRATGGTESVETALQIAIAYTGRDKIMSVEGCYHGNSIATLSLGSAENKDSFGNMIHNFYRVNLPLDDSAADKVETRLKNRDIAAFIMEPVICNLGVYIPEKGFMKRLRELCSEYGTLLIIDEVATGFGRTGKMFACQHFDIEPDILCMAKAMSGGYAAIGATITTEKISLMVEGKVTLYSTYGWHPLSVAATLANLRYLRKHEGELLENVHEINAYFISRLLKMNFRQPVNINAMGMAIGVDVGDSKYATKLMLKCLKKGLILSMEENCLTMFPPLSIDRKTAKRGLDILEDCL